MYQLLRTACLRIKYDLKLASEATPGLLVIQIQIPIQAACIESFLSENFEEERIILNLLNYGNFSLIYSTFLKYLFFSFVVSNYACDMNKIGVEIQRHEGFSPN